MPHGLVRAAALNDAEWCAAFCRTHGVAGRFSSHSWSSPVRTPPYYPDAVTLLPEATAEQILAGVDTGKGCSVKDSFARLDLAPFGFAPLFRAEWVAREPAGARPAANRWSALTGKEQLGEWEAAWGESPEGPGFFRDALLEDETVAVLAEYDGDRVIAGAVANRSATVIGLSNLFDAAGDLESAWAGGTAAATALWGAMPAVGYDSGALLDAAHRAGFESIGELVVWLS